ncbi:hypothetical protein, partial [Roseicella aquatilis]|uniref:hypothetical protein n=1 Tax=Roseicella aquatilis TaxID=2527868 RepID=UPI00197F08BB
EMFEPTFGLGGSIFLSLMGPLEFFQKKSLKKKHFSNSFHWIQIGETLVLSFSYNGSQKCLSQRSDWEGPFSSL